MKDRAAVQLRAATGMFQLGKTGDLHFPLYNPVYVSMPQADFCGFCKNMSDGGVHNSEVLFCSVIVKHQIFPF